VKIHLKLYGVFRSAAKAGDVELDVKTGSTVKSLIDQVISQENFRSLRALLMDDSTSDPRSNALILVSGREIGALAGVDTVLREGDEVAILPISHGG
jgi:molybdopterin converting factor small subunit